ncbi:hypothetical protein B1H58_13715 [Pantoea alhagi]|uniref:Uncharacterized protein n=1 Tax=Pantoea alhagi TaxID=1891675 RepID=A0A1W6B793_9GAMM|nr:hypothetical protein B1H58_13715 [Pantoea alhagi]
MPSALPAGCYSNRNISLARRRLSADKDQLAALNWEDYRQSRGQMQIIDYDQQTYNYSKKGGGGLSHKNYSLTAGLQYHF